MARQPQLGDGTTSRMQSAPINIAYGNQDAQRNYHQSRWSNQMPFQFDEEIEEQNHHSDEDEDQMMMMQNGFSGGVIDEDVEATISISSSEEKDNDVVVGTPIEQTNDAITQQKIAEMTDDLFEQLLAENERKLRQLISYVENAHLVLK